MEGIIKKYEDKFNDLIEKYKLTYKDIRLEHNMYLNKQSNGNLDSANVTKLKRVEDIETKLNNIFIDMLNETGITNSSYNTELAKKVEGSKTKIKDIYDNKATYSYEHGQYIENAALEREKILLYHVLREKLFFALFLICLGASIYVIFRDLDENKPNDSVRSVTKKPRKKPSTQSISQTESKTVSEPVSEPINKTESNPASEQVQEPLPPSESIL
jgi:hypothetical protein